MSVLGYSQRTGSKCFWGLKGVKENHGGSAQTKLLQWWPASHKVEIQDFCLSFWDS